VLLGAATGTAILVGALAVGDSVRYSLRFLALARLGGIYLALSGQSRFFGAGLAEALAAELRVPVAPIIMLRGTATIDERGAGRVQVVGVTDRFWQLAGSRPLLPGGREAVAINERLARRIGARLGDELLLRVESPSLLSRDAPLSTLEHSTVTLRLTVAAIAPDAHAGRFSLEANQVPPLTAFVPLALLQQQIARPARVNTLLVGKGAEAAPTTTAAAAAALRRHWRVSDAGLELREVRQQGQSELRTDRVFLEPPVARAAERASAGARGVLTYFVNELRVGARATPYSVVSALDAGVVPARMRDDEIIVNRWLADDLQARPGDVLRLAYFILGRTRRLEERSSAFRIRAVVPLDGAALDPDLMPTIPGLTDRKHCRDWEPGIPIHLEKIRPKDEQYWNAYRGTPKAFITLRAGQRIWANRFGNLTAVRYPAASGSLSAIESAIRERLDPASLGLNFVPVRDQALAAGSQAMDFGTLFLGFSLFLIAAALLLTALLFTFSVEQRREEIGVLLALGFSPGRVQWLLLSEGCMLALMATAAGAAAGVLYTRALVRGLATVWRGAVADTALQFHAEPATLAVGAGAGFVAAALTIALVTWRQARAPARELLAGEAIAETGGGRKRRATGRESPFGFLSRLLSPISCTLLTAIGALALLFAALRGDAADKAGLFFGAGALLLIACMAACSALFTHWRGAAARARLSLPSLGVRNSVRRQGRSLATVALLACGSFLVVAVGANRQEPPSGVSRRSTGTGGFALYGETALPVYDDLNSAEGRENFGLDAELLREVQFVPLRLRPGDEASCLNLNRPQVPRLLGVDPDALRRRNAFAFAQRLSRSGDPWSLIERAQPDGAVPAVGDTNTVVWSLGKSLGDTLTYVDDQGRAFPVRIVGILTNSILQGSLLISEGNFVERFPSQEGYQVFLIDAPGSRPEAASRALASALEDVGPELTPAPERLAAFNTVENSYLSIFAALGGLGLLLGSLGLGVVVLRNVLERRGELALLRAVGFRRRALQSLLFSEAALLLFLGLAAGVVSALVAVLPALRSPGAEVPIASLGVTLAAVFLSGFLWTWGAAALALRGPLLPALRNE
jgi:ABC-type antimicrobial peptide transport system permease subunit